MMKKVLAVTALALLCLTGCNQKDISTHETTEDTAASTVTTTTTSSETITSSSSSESVKPALWSPKKDQALADFMTAWQADMGQSYQRFRPGHNTRLYGLSLPDEVLTGSWQVAVDEQPVSIEWWETGSGSGDYQLVAVYSDADHAEYLQAHVYFFVIHRGQPRVLITMQNQGNQQQYLYFSDTENTDLKNGFAKIVEQA